MKKLNTLLTAGAVSSLLLVSASSFAASTQVRSFIDASCEISGLDAVIDVPELSPGVVVTNDALTIACNDIDGAELVMITSEGGFESDDFEDLSINYNATFSSEFAPDLVLETTGLNDESASQIIPGSFALAAGGTAGLEIEVVGTGRFAGGYSDTLTIELTAQ